MAYDLEPGDRVLLEYRDEDGCDHELELTVEHNTTEADPDACIGEPKVKLRTGKRRTSSDVLLYPDGTLRKRPRFNANGRGENGVLTGLELLEVMKWEAVGPGGDVAGLHDTKRDALDACPDGGHAASTWVEAEGR